MATNTQTIVTYVDDLSGKEEENVTTIRFAFGETEYEIDLGAANVTALSKVMAKYVAAARPVEKSMAKTKNAARTDLSEVRAWAQAQGMQVNDRGRVPNAVLEAFDNAMDA